MASRKKGRAAWAVRPCLRAVSAAAFEDGEVHVVGGGVPAAVVVVGIAAAPAPAVLGKGAHNAAVRGDAVGAVAVLVAGRAGDGRVGRRGGVAVEVLHGVDVDGAAPGVAERVGVPCCAGSL